MSTSNILVPKPSGMKPAPSPAFCVTSSNRPFAEIAVQRVQLLREVGDEEVRQTVAVDVAAIDAHAGLRLAVAVEADAGRVGHVDEGAVAVVLVEEVPHHVVGDVDVGVAVAIEIAEGDAEALAGGVGDPRRARDVGERAVAVVAKQPIRHPIEHRRMAVHAVAVLAQPAERVVASAGSRGSWRRRGRDRRRGRKSRNPVLVLHSEAPPATPAVAVTSANVPSPLFLYRMSGPKLVTKRSR